MDFPGGVVGRGDAGGPKRKPAGQVGDCGCGPREGASTAHAACAPAPWPASKDRQTDRPALLLAWRLSLWPPHASVSSLQGREPFGGHARIRLTSASAFHVDARPWKRPSSSRVPALLWAVTGRCPAPLPGGLPPAPQAGQGPAPQAPPHPPPCASHPSATCRELPVAKRAASPVNPQVTGKRGAPDTCLVNGC